jgi:hypothetical protein
MIFRETSPEKPAVIQPEIARMREATQFDTPTMKPFSRLRDEVVRRTG